MVDPLYRALVLAALGLAGCDGPSSQDAGTPEVDAGEESDTSIEDVTPTVDDAGGQQDAPCPADAELETPPCYLIL